MARIALVATAALAMVVVASTSSVAANRGTVNGNSSTACGVNWNAQTTLNTNLTNTDPTYPGLMVDSANVPVTYSNGGYIKSVEPEVASGPGILLINHWYVGNEAPGPLTATAITPVNWRIPIATDHAMTGVTLTFVIPRGSGFTFTSGANITGWGSPYSNYTWTSPVITPTSNGLTWTVPLGDLAANTGVVIAFAGTVPVGTVLSENSVATAHLVAAYVPGTGTCPATPATVSGKTTVGCTADWAAEATYHVTDGRKDVADVTRARGIQQSFGDPGAFRIDGWSGGAAGGSPSMMGRFIVATDDPVANGTLVIHFDPNIAGPPARSLANPAPSWAVAGHPDAVTIDAGTWDTGARTVTYHVTMPAASSFFIGYSSSALAGSFFSGASYSNTATFTGTYPTGSASCVVISPAQAPELAATGNDLPVVPLGIAALAIAAGAIMTTAREPRRRTNRERARG